MSKDNLIIFLSHCDTEEKLNVLEENIKFLKEYNFDILLTSYLPLPNRIVESVDYFLFVKNNPVLNWPVSAGILWRTVRYKEKYLKLTRFTPDASSAAIIQMINTGNLAVTLDYKHYSFINYDLIITDEVLDTLNNPKPVLFSSEGEQETFPSFLFSSFDKPNLKKLLSTISNEDYITGFPSQQIKFDYIEDYWKHLSTVFNYERLPYNLHDKINSKNQSLLNFNTDNDLFRVFHQSNFNNFNYTDNEIHTEPPRIIFYDIKESFEFSINENRLTTTGSTVVIEDMDITKFGYYKDNTYIDLMHIFKSPLLSKISVE